MMWPNAVLDGSICYSRLKAQLFMQGDKRWGDY